MSIIIPVHNRATQVLEAIESAASAASSGGLRCEILVVDDGSTDGTNDAVRSSPVRLRLITLRQRSGQARARNSGLAVASGDFIKFLDSDDVLIPGHLRREIAEARACRADIVTSGWRTRLLDGTVVDRQAPHFSAIIDDLLAGRAVPTSAALYRRGQTALWDPEIPKLADWDFFVRSALKAGKIARLEGLAYELREHRGPRVSRTTMLINAQSHHAVLRKLERHLSASGLLTEARSRRLAQYYYKELSVLCLEDRPAFESALQHIFELDPSFRPREEERRRWARFSAAVFGTGPTLRGYAMVKRAVRYLGALGSGRPS